MNRNKMVLIVGVVILVVALLFYMQKQRGVKDTVWYEDDSGNVVGEAKAKICCRRCPEDGEKICDLCPLPKDACHRRWVVE